MRIWREYSFEAAHWLPRVPEDHKCRNLHGHSWRVEIHTQGIISDAGWIRDYAEIDAAWRPIFETLDHHCLNEVAGLENPTSENLAVWIWRTIELSGLSRVTVRETIRSGCEYEGCEDCDGFGTTECGVLDEPCDSDPCHGHCEVTCLTCKGRG